MVDAITDVNIHIDIYKPAPKVGLGRPLILAKSDTATSSYKEYTSLESIEADYARTTSVYMKASAIFKQDNAPDKVAVGAFADGEAAVFVEKQFNQSWHFALLADYVAADALAISNFIEEKTFKFLVVNVADVAGAQQFKGNARTIVLVHNNSEENIDSALLGAVASKPVGSVTWKFKSLKSVTATEITADELKAIHEAGAIAYVNIAGIAQTSEGITAGIEYIDALHGDDWIKTNLETRIQTLLSKTDKLSFDASGISLLQSEVKTVLAEAFSNGIISLNDETGEGDYSMEVKQRADLKPEDIAARNYKGISFRYKRAGAIHTVDVYGTIEV